MHDLFVVDRRDLWVPLPVLLNKYIRSKMCLQTRSVIQSLPTHHIRKGSPYASHSAHSPGNVCGSCVSLCSICCATRQLCSSRSASTLQKATVASEVIAEPMGGFGSAAHYSFERFRPPLIWQFDLGTQGAESTKPRENSRFRVSNSVWLRRKRRGSTLRLTILGSRVSPR